MESQSKNSVGPIVGIIIILLVVIVGGAYFWGKTIKEAPVQSSATTTVATSTAPADDTASIEADLNAINPDAIDTNLSK